MKELIQSTDLLLQERHLLAHVCLAAPQSLVLLQHALMVLVLCPEVCLVDLSLRGTLTTW